MTVRYPAGVRPLVQGEGATKKKKGSPKLKVAAGNRGMDFEAAINEANAYYLEKGLCLVTKRPTPIRVVKVDYEHGPKIVQAFYETQSTTDYNGVYQGHYLDFEAKSTRSKTSFPFSNVPLQQIRHLQNVLQHGGWAFFLIHFALLGETYFIPASYLIERYLERKRASLTIEEIRKNGLIVPEGYRPRYDYLPVATGYFLK